MLNFCIFVFIIYAVASSARTILFGYSRKSSRKAVASHSGRSSVNRSTRIIRLSRYRRTNLDKRKAINHAA